MPFCVQPVHENAAIVANLTDPSEVRSRRLAAHNRAADKFVADGGQPEDFDSEAWLAKWNVAESRRVRAALCESYVGFSLVAAALGGGLAKVAQEGARKGRVRMSKNAKAAAKAATAAADAAVAGAAVA